MNIQCDCGSFEARLSGMPKNTPGRLVCYCDDCQVYLKRLGRAEILDTWGGTEIVPVYPNEFEIVKGFEHLQCNKIHSKGLERWSASCCNSPIGNTKVGFPWVGILNTAYQAKDPKNLKSLGDIKSRVMGKHKVGAPPFKVSEKMGLGDAFNVIPFILKGFFQKRFRGSPFYQADGVTPVKEPVYLRAD